jgi:hypothetical protein
MMSDNSGAAYVERAVINTSGRLLPQQIKRTPVRVIGLISLRMFNKIFPPSRLLKKSVALVPQA